jgi:outer membrane protein OmpA-like peptidoglycan-associated protein
MWISINKLSILCAFTLILPVTTLAELPEDTLKSVDHISWHPQVAIDPQILLAQPIPQDKVSLFFIRETDLDDGQTSVNLGINGEYQGSLKPGGYTQVYTCAGTNQISAVTTSQKTNNLLSNAITLNLPAQQSYFFYVEVDEQQRISLQQVNPEAVDSLMTDKHYQQHQISRVTSTCAATPVPPTAPPVLVEEVSIEMRVFFDTDKAVIQPQYFSRVADVAAFMQEYSSTSAVIKGHTDSTASDAYNQKLSERRAQAVQTMLVNQYDIDPNRITTIGYGESEPVASNATKEGRQMNRRVIAVVAPQ